MPKSATKKRGRSVKAAAALESGGSGEEAQAEQATEGKSPESPSADEGENDPVSAGKSEEGITGDAATGVKTRSRAAKTERTSTPADGGRGDEVGAEQATDGKSPESPADDEGENELVSAGKSEEGITGDAATGANTRSRKRKAAAEVADVATAASPKKAEVVEQATPKKSNLGAGGKNMAEIAPSGDDDGQDDGGKQVRTSPRRKKGTSRRHHDAQGNVEGSVDLDGSVSESVLGSDEKPYASSFSLRMRFLDLAKLSGASFKYTKADDGKVRNRKIVSEKQPESWLDSSQTKALPPLPPAKTPNHHAASGHIGSIDSEFLSQSSFVIPQALKGKRGRRLKYFQLFSPSAQIEDGWLKNPMENFAKKVMRFRPTTRSSLADLMRGNDIFVGSSDLPALEFVRKEDDDIELINNVESLGPNTARLWHSSNISKDGMMWRAIMSVLNNESRSTGYGLRNTRRTSNSWGLSTSIPRPTLSVASGHSILWAWYCSAIRVTLPNWAALSLLTRCRCHQCRSV